MLSITGNARIYLCKDPINMHMSFEGLSSLVLNIFREELISSTYFVFINRDRDRIKVLYWDTDGLAIWYKRLEKGTFPKQQIHECIMERRDFFMMLEGIVPRRKYHRYKAV